ncbi:MAG: sulfite exporter TauE/SafE family protein [Bacteroidota bacterium]|nr:sulfite exporter TauE/SafE family protein [Bacteroidota bacterium]
MDLSTLFILLLIGVVAGIASGFVGIGGGLIIVPALIYLTGVDQHVAQGTSLAMMLPPIGILAALNYHSEQSVEWTYAACLAITFVIGAWLGSKWSLKLSPTVVRLVFAAFMFYTASIMAIKSLKEIFPGDGS